MFHLFVATPEKVFYDGEAVSVNVPGSTGYFEVLSRHAAIISALTKGWVVIRDNAGERTKWKISGGFFEMANNKAVLLANSFEKAGLEEDELGRTRRKQD